MRQRYANRSQLLTALLGLVAVAVLVQMARIQNSSEAGLFIAQGNRYAGEFQTVYPERGEIYDRNGHLLAGNKTVYEVGVTLSDVINPDSLALTLSTYLGMDYNVVYDKLTNSPKDWTYVVIQDFVASDRVAALQELMKEMETLGDHRLDGLGFKPHVQRSYPENSLASNILGFVPLDGHGYFGVEEKYNDLLAGNPVQVWIPRDPTRTLETPKIPNGTTLILTIDRDLQAKVENILDTALSTYGAVNGTIIVMNPRNGEILAMATTPRMDLNNYGMYFSLYDNGSEYDRAIGTTYEPGSVIKILTMASALDSGLVKPDTTYLDTGSIMVGGLEIKNWNKDAWGTQDMIGCLQHSLNVCMAWLSTQLGAKTFYSYMDHFGVGHPTGVDLAGEAAGRLKVPGDGDWYPIDLGTNAFGQGVTVTPIQMVMAASSIANDGRMVTPHVLFAMVRDGHQYTVPAQYAGSPISKNTANTLNEMLAISLEKESSNALVPGYRVAGKTGTAQIPSDYGYDAFHTNASFVGWGPVDDPQFMIYVWLEKPSASIWGSETAAPVFAQVVQQTVISMNIPPDAIRKQLVSK